MSSQLEAALTDVRTAYRLLFEYQKHVLSLVKFIGHHYSYTYEGGSPRFSSAASKGKGNLNNWSWDWLNMYLYQFNFTAKNNCSFAVLLQSDSGYYQREAADPLSVEQFETAENSTTRLHLMAGQTGCDFVKLMSDCLRPGSDKPITIPLSDVDVGIEQLSMAYSLEDFQSREGTINRLDDFYDLCQSAGLTSFSPSTSQDR